MPFWSRNKEAQPAPLVPATAGGYGGGGRTGGYIAPPQQQGRNRVPGGGYAPPAQPQQQQPKQIFDAGAVALSYWGKAPDYVKL